MTIETETILIKFLERIETEAKETNRKLDKVIEDVNEIKVNQVRLEGEIQNVQVRLEGKIETLQVEVQNIKEDVRELKTEVKEVKTEIKETKNEVSGLSKWVIGLILTLGLVTLLLKAFDLFPTA